MFLLSLIFYTNNLIFHFSNFIETFAVGNEFEVYYLRQLEVIFRVGEFAFDLDCCHLYYNLATRTLYEQLLKYPQEMVPILDHVVNELFVK